ncbi:DUF3861 domain-containing protein [Vogesella indigofera]|uniref:DUF3861 domain-containing protein n=1 Tax=Vogesella indigofera TaxID=45465 RepID=UPI00234F7FEA|nr:DUF3861 domain-containing protein [Vogesella indigofera]MDC7709869.1 DUF3861 domain-containing protein [Vogesella indigofera]
MKQHQYRITVEHLARADGSPSPYAAPLQFAVGNHDDLLLIAQRLRQRDDLAGINSDAFAIGLKLFGEVLLEHKQHPLFAELRPHFAAFMLQLKKGAAAQ